MTVDQSGFQPGYQPAGYEPAGAPPAGGATAAAAGSTTPYATPQYSGPAPTGGTDSGAGHTSSASSAGEYTGARSGDSDIGDMSLGQLVAKVTDDLSTLMRQEIALAKAEVTTEAKKAGKGAGMLGGAGYAGHLTVLFLSFALAFALGSVIPLGWSSLIVAAIWGIVAAVLALSGKKKLKEVNPKPERTIDTVREVPSALKG